MSRKDIGDELLTLLAAGHETTAATLGWAFERISRHPDVLDKARRGSRERRQRVPAGHYPRGAAGQNHHRPGRPPRYSPTFQLSEWVIRRLFDLVAISEAHVRAQEFPEPERFDPQRFIGNRPPLAWIPFGGGTRRCVGAAFANVEMDVVLRTVLRHFIIETTTAPGEKMHSRGVAFTPKDGGRIVVHRVKTRCVNDSSSTPRCGQLLSWHLRDLMRRPRVGCP